VSLSPDSAIQGLEINRAPAVADKRSPLFKIIFASIMPRPRAASVTSHTFDVSI
jgi:hypothetical protein